MDGVRLTIAVATVLRVFLDDVHRARYGYELMSVTGFPSGKLYPILARLESAGWLVRERDAASPSGGPPRVHYRLDPDAVETARDELAALSAQISGRSRDHRRLGTEPA